MTVAILPKHEFVYDGAMIKIYHANVGQGLPKHQHLYAHATFCSAGSCVVRMEAKEYVLTKASRPLNLPQNKWHEIEALQNETVFVNVFSENKR